MGAFSCPRRACYNAGMIYIGLHTLLPPASIYYTPPHLRRLAVPIVANPPFVADRAALDAPTAPGKTLPATTIIARLQRDSGA